MKHTLHTIFGTILIIAAFSAVLSAQTPRQVYIIKSIRLQYDQPQKFNQRHLTQQFLKRPYTPKVEQQIQQYIKQQLHKKGYYFPFLTLSEKRIDAINHEVELVYQISTGYPLYLESVSINLADSLSRFTTERIREIIATYRDNIYTEVLAKSLYDDILNTLEVDGYPLATIDTQDLTFRESVTQKKFLLQLQLAVNPGDSVAIAYLNFPNQKYDISDYLTRLLRFKPNRPFDARKIRKYRKILQRQEFLKEVGIPELRLDKKGQYFLDIPFKETPSTSFDGIVGYIPPPATSSDESGYFTGLVDIGIRNLFGGGRKINVFWQKQDQFSDEFRLAYQEPFLLGLPFHLGLGMSRLVRDTTYIEWQYHGNVELPLSESLSAFVTLSTRNVSPDSLASRILRLPRTESFMTESGIKWDIRNNLRNPSRGVALEVSFGISRKKNIGPQYLITEDSLLQLITMQNMKLSLSGYWPVFKHQVFANRFHARLINSKGEILRITEQFWFGGATTVRGFREAQFYGKNVFWLNSEYRFIMGPDTRFFIFVDNGYFERSSPDVISKWLTGYGLGIRLPAPLGIMQIEFGLEKGAPFSEGKLHIRLVNNF
jgi:outer membrane protein insertion porin family